MPKIPRSPRCARGSSSPASTRARTRVVADDPRRGLRLISAPPIQRTPMAPEPWRLGAIFPLLRPAPARARTRRRSAPPPQRRPWQRAAAMRRIALLALVDRADRVRDRLHVGRAAVSRPPAARGRHPRAVRDPDPVGVGRLLDRDGRLRRAAARARSLRDLGARRARRRAIADRRAHRDRDADLQRERRARVRRPARDVRFARAHGRARRISISSC